MGDFDLLGVPKLRHVLIASVAIAALSTPAHAEDGSLDWSGFYVGAQGGFVSSAPNFTGTIAVDEGPYPEEGFIGGVHFGHDWQIDNVVFGFVGDINYLGVEQTNLSGSFTGKDEDYAYDIDWMATARARVGVLPTEQLLIYGTVGAAVAEIAVDSRVEQNFAPDQVFSDSGLQFGGVVGVGAEFALAPNWSVKAEILHAEFGTVDAEPGSNPSGFNPSVTSATIGLSFKFGR
ncbi:outer membrane protein [Pseudohoeflea coraliihabitans]|uniref:Porin family protein n=1 Tax=Pseudohoeflea coraliihabitans TaxID=2860393 RepID=A0ABS6WL40_9HYPH|nr:outer membrane protein [Pseudohoeflea sp. DP4N28-3]MBW3096661.1 porin family protein [Pseudohoeflea sp. DP4N28-3]